MTKQFEDTEVVLIDDGYKERLFVEEYEQFKEHEVEILLRRQYALQQMPSAEEQRHRHNVTMFWEAMKKLVAVCNELGNKRRLGRAVGYLPRTVDIIETEVRMAGAKVGLDVGQKMMASIERLLCGDAKVCEACLKLAREFERESKVIAFAELCQQAREIAA